MSEHLTFTRELEVVDEDIDALGHASNLAFARWIQDVAVAHSSAVGLGLDAYMRLGAVFVIVRQEIDYLRPALRGDVLEARTWLPTVMAAKSQRATELVRKADRQLLARGLTTWGYIELATGRPRRIPDEVRVAFRPFMR